MNIFRRFQEVGVTVLIASHNVQLIEHFGSRRIHLEGGHLVAGETAATTADHIRFDPSGRLIGPTAPATQGT